MQIFMALTRIAFLSILINTIMYWYLRLDFFGNLPVWLVYIRRWALLLRL